MWNAFPCVKELGFCYDTSHTNLRDQFYLLKKYNHLLSALHISDNDGAADRHWLPFDGEIDFAEKVLPHLKGTDAPFTMELFSDLKKYPDEQEFLYPAHQCITKLTEDMYKLDGKDDANAEKEKNDLFSLFPPDLKS